MSASSSAMTTRCGLAPSVVEPVMAAIVAVAAAISDLGGSSMVVGRALVSQLAEETDSKPVQCEFESHRGHQCCCRSSAYPNHCSPLVGTIWARLLSCASATAPKSSENKS